MYGAALPAGSYGRPRFGQLYTQRDHVSRRGALVRDLAAKRALRGLGAMNLCEDPGWNFVQALVGAGGAVTSALSTGTNYTGPGGAQQTAGGSTAGRATGAGLTATAAAWQATCAAQAARGADQGTGANTDELRALLDAQARNNEMALLEARRSSDQALQAMLMAQQQRGATSQELISGVPNQTLLLGGLAFAGVIGLALLLKRK